MANPHRGQVALEVEGAVYTLSYSINAMCELEEALDRPVMSVLRDLEQAQADPTSLSMRVVRKLVWAAFQDNHPEIDERKAGLIASAAGLPSVMEAITRAIMAAFPSEEKGSRPPKAATSK